MLLITAILFVGIAETLPKQPTTVGAASDPSFYYFMGFLFIFDIFVLIVDYSKSDRERTA
jgi:hypothetical protein